MSVESEPTRLSRRYGILTVVCGALVVWVFLMGGWDAIANAGVMDREFPRSRESDLWALVRDQHSAARQLALAIAMYTGDYDDRWPPNLELVTPYIGSKRVVDLTAFRYQIPPYPTTAKTPADYIVATEPLADKRTAYIHADFHVTVGVKPD